MDNLNVNVNDAVAASDELDALLGDLEVLEAGESTEAVTDIAAIEAEINEVVAEVEAETVEAETEISALDAIGQISEEDIESAIEALEMDETIQAAQQAQGETGSPAADTEEQPAAAAPTPKAPRAKKAATPKTPRVGIADLKDESFVLDANDDVSDLPKLRADVMSKRPAQVKVAEKFDNLLVAVSQGKLPSSFTVDSYAILKAKGKITSSELVAHLTSSGFDYSIGTARSQAGQMMALFPVMKIATRSGKELVFNEDSTLGMALDALLTPPAAPAPVAAAPAPTPKAGKGKKNTPEAANDPEPTAAAA